MDKNIDYYRIVSGGKNLTAPQSGIQEIQDDLFEDFDDNLFVRRIEIIDQNGNIVKSQNAVYQETFNYDTKAMETSLIVKPNENLSVGDLIRIGEDRFFVTSYDNSFLMYYRFLLTKITYDISFYKNGKLITLPIYITTGTRNYLSNKSSTYMVLPESVFIGYTPNWGVLDRNDINNIRFILKNFAYKITGVDNLTVEGVTFIEIQEDLLSDDDNVELGLANYYSNQKVEEINLADKEVNNSNHTISLSNSKIVLSPDITSIKLGSEVNIEAALLCNDKIVKSRIGFVVSNCDGSNIEYVTFISDNNKLKLIATDNTKYLFKKINLRVFIEDIPSLFVERQIKIISLM